MKELISIILVVFCWQSLFAEGLSKEEEQTAWNSIRAKFLGNDSDVDIFRNDILIKLDGNISQNDSITFNELIGQFQEIIPNHRIELSQKRIANLVFNINNHEAGQNSRIFWGSIFNRKTDFIIPEDATQEIRKKIIYYNFYRSLVNFTPSTTEKTTIRGCVFDEGDPLKITYSPFDQFILGTLYSPDFKERFRDNYTKMFSYWQYFVSYYKEQFRKTSLFISFLCGLILITIFVAKGVFKRGPLSWYDYNKKGFFIILTVMVCIVIIGLSNLRIEISETLILVNFAVRGFIAVNLIFLAEKYLFQKIDLGGRRVILIFLTTSTALTIVSIGDIELLPGGFIIALIRSIIVFFDDRYSSIINEKDVQLARMNELHKQAELQSLQAKINPHFLYNALNSIASLATADSKKTEQMALSLSDFFKYAINREQKLFNSLSEELNAIRTYLGIEKVRFGDRMNFEIDCPGELMDVQIPQLLVQPLVENAVKHGLSKITGKGFIRICVSKKEQQIKIRVYDNGPAFPEGPLTGYGIQNTQERLDLLYDKKASINWFNGEEKFIELSLPS